MVAVVRPSAYDDMVILLCPVRTHIIAVIDPVLPPLIAPLFQILKRIRQTVDILIGYP